jgi:hypothetical protein
MDTEDKPLPSYLPSLETALDEASKGIEEVPGAPLSISDGLHPTIARLRAKRLKAEMKKAERAKKKEERFQRGRKLTSQGRAWHPAQKRATVRKRSKKAKARYRQTLESRYSRWLWVGGVKKEGMSLAEYVEVMGRFVPRSRLRLYETRQQVCLWRVDASKPWSLLNLSEWITIGSKRFQWKKLRKAGRGGTK